MFPTDLSEISLKLLIMSDLSGVGVEAIRSQGSAVAEAGLHTYDSEWVIWRQGNDYRQRHGLRLYWTETAFNTGTAMISLITDNLDSIAALCRQYRIQSLDLFGSAATGRFDPATSDIDLLCDLGEYEPGVADRLFGFADAFEALLGLDVDLLTVPMIRNPYFRQAVDEQRVRLYEARDSEAAA